MADVIEKADENSIKVTTTGLTWVSSETTDILFDGVAAANPPKLTVTFTLPATGTGNFFQLW